MFHIHIGYENPNVDTSLALVKYMDAFLGIPSVVKDKDKKRRSLYGKAGCFRLTDYGVEYRVLSSAMMGSPSKLSFIWKQLQKVMKAYRIGYALPSIDLVQEAINSSDVELAKQLITRYNLA